MELVTDLTTEAFIGAVKRFTARRGHCKKLYCDNATNFVGANNQLREMRDVIHEESANDKITNFCNKQGLEFKFIPPRAPHFGGLWEAGVKSAKTLLQKILTSASLTYEEMETVILEAEAILNSRPLTALSDDPNDLQALTPGHLLIGEPLTSTIDPRAHENQLSKVSRWKLVTALKSEFWRRWHNEYLSGLQHRYKWKKRCQNAKKGMMVIIKDDNLPSFKWPLGRISNVVYGDDGLVRVADVRTANGIVRRPIHKLAPLPVDNEEDYIAEENNHNTGDMPTVKRMKLHNMSLAINVIMMICLFFPLCFAASIEVNPFENNPGIHYERLGASTLISSEWNLVMYISMQSFWAKSKIIEGYPKTLQQICTSMPASSNCQTIHNLVETMVTEIRINNEILEGHKKSRRKRGALNIVDNLGRSLFGILDSEYAREAEFTITKIIQNEEYLVKNLQNMTFYLDSTMNVMKRNQNSIHDEVARLEKGLNQLERRQLKDMSSLMYMEGAFQTILEILHLQRIQDALIDILVDTHHGRISPELLTPQQLHTALFNIKANLPNELKLPTSSEDLLKYYKLMTVEGRVTTNYIIFKIVIPLVSIESFELLKMISIPWEENGTYYAVDLDASFLIINLHRDKYLPLRENEISSCQLIDPEMYICHQNHPVYKIGTTSAKCELELLSHNANDSSCIIRQTKNGPYWIQLNNPNSWIYSVGNNYTVNAVCKESPIKLKLHRTGTLKLAADCSIRQPMITIQGYNSYRTTLHKSYVPSTNFSAVNQNQNDPALTVSSRALEDLHLRMTDLQLTLPNELSAHDIHHYSISYIILFGFLVSLAGLYFRKRISLICKQVDHSPEDEGEPGRDEPAREEPLDSY